PDPAFSASDLVPAHISMRPADPTLAAPRARAGSLRAACTGQSDTSSISRGIEPVCDRFDDLVSAHAAASDTDGLPPRSRLPRARLGFGTHSPQPPARLATS